MLRRNWVFFHLRQMQFDTTLSLSEDRRKSRAPATSLVHETSRAGSGNCLRWEIPAGGDPLIVFPPHAVPLCLWIRDKIASRTWACVARTASLADGSRPAEVCLHHVIRRMMVRFGFVSAGKMSSEQWPDAGVAFSPNRAKTRMPCVQGKIASTGAFLDPYAVTTSTE